MNGFGVDIDGTVAATGELLWSRRGMPIENYPSPLPEGFWGSQEGYEIYRDVEPIPGAVDALRMLVRIEPVFYVTIRSPESKLITYWWLQKHGFPPGIVLFCANRGEKATVTRNALVVFEDDQTAPLFYQCALAIIARPYNTGDKTWEQVLREGGYQCGRPR